MQSKVKLNPCPLCKFDAPFCSSYNGISCPNCGLWFSFGTRAGDIYREYYNDPNCALNGDWGIEVWNKLTEKK